MMNQAHVTNGCAVVLAEVTHRLVIRNKPARHCPSRKSYPRVAVVQSGQDRVMTIVTDRSICRPSGASLPHRMRMTRVGVQSRRQAHMIEWEDALTNGIHRT